MKQAAFKILHTYINRHGHLESRVNCTLHGASTDEAKNLHETHVHFAERAWVTGHTWKGVPVRITGIVLIDAAENVIAEWTRPVEMERAA